MINNPFCSKKIDSKIDLLNNINKFRTTTLGVRRIKANLGLAQADVVDYCKQKVLADDCNIYKKGKNWYCQTEDILITINAHSYTIITAHKIKRF